MLPLRCRLNGRHHKKERGAKVFISALCAAFWAVSEHSPLPIGCCFHASSVSFVKYVSVYSWSLYPQCPVQYLTCCSTFVEKMHIVLYFYPFVSLSPPACARTHTHARAHGCMRVCAHIVTYLLFLIKMFSPILR